MPSLFKNCTHLNAKYRHGVGRVGAHDHTSGVPVTNFVHSNRLYALAMKYNRGLDHAMAVARSHVRLCRRAKITGVASLDVKHGQTGVAPNAIELHPILGFHCLTGF